MRIIKSATLFCLVSIILSSCVFSLFPIYTEETLVYDPGLIGKWELDETVIEITKGELTASKNMKTEKVDGAISLKETPGEGDSPEDIKKHLAKAGYTFTVSTEDEIHQYKVHLVDIGGEHYLNLYPVDSNGKYSAKEADPYADNLYPVHTFMKVEFDAQQLKLINFNLEKLNKMFKKNLIRLRHEIVYDKLMSTKSDGDVIITAKSEEIQKFIKTYAKDPSVFYDAEVYARK